MTAARFDTTLKTKGHTYRQWMVAILANTVIATYGLQAGWISAMTKFLQSETSPTGRPVTDSELSWIASIFCLSAVVGVPLFAYITDRFGRKLGVLLITVPQALCWLLKFSSGNTTILIIARICVGLSAGACFSVVPIYVKEISQDDVKGKTGSLLMVNQNLGLFVMYAMGAYFDYYTVLWIVVSLPIATGLLMLKAPESPSYLVKIGKVEEATATLAWLRGVNIGDKEVETEISSISIEKLHFESLPSISFTSIFRNRAWRRGIIIMTCLMSVNALNGIFTILTFASVILGSSGVGVSAELQTLSFPVVAILGSFVAMACVERYGRKPLLAATMVFMTSSMVGLGTITWLQDQGVSVSGWWSAVLMMLANAAYAAGGGTVPYIMMAEMFNFQIRAKVACLILSYGWILSFIQLLVYTPISAALGVYTTFYCFGVINLLGFCICFALPETKGRSIEEIEKQCERKLF